MNHLYQNPLWPSFNWNQAQVSTALIDCHFYQGKLLALNSEFIHSYEISDTKKHLLEEIINPDQQLTIEILNGWQASLYPTGYAGTKKITVGTLRQKYLEPYNIPFQMLSDEINQFLYWYKETPEELNAITKSGIAFFWFLIISPFDAGNFEVASSIAELILNQNERTLFRTYDLSLLLSENKKEITDLISQYQTTDITKWLLQYLNYFEQATKLSLNIANKANNDAIIWKKLAQCDLNPRQKLILGFILDENMQTQITNKLYVEITKTSRESAKRDLASLLKQNILTPGSKSGRSTYYLFNSVKFVG